MIAVSTPLPTREDYERMADEYQATLTLENYMENQDQALQREMTLASFANMRILRPEVRLCNELLIQYPTPDGGTGWVVPDNMIVVQAEPIDSNRSFAMRREKSGVLMAMEYVSEGSERKDYEVNFAKYRDGVKAAYYLMFHPGKQDLQVYRLTDGEYVKLEPDVRGRVAIPELEMEVAIHEKWTRFWFRGELLPITTELVVERTRLIEGAEKLAVERDELAEERDELAARVERESAARLRAEEDRKNLEAELERLRAELAKGRP